MTQGKKPPKRPRLHCRHVLLTDESLANLEREALEVDRKISPLLRLIVEERYKKKST